MFRHDLFWIRVRRRFGGLFAWLTIQAVRTKVLHGLGWRAARTDQPVLFWLGVGCYLLNFLVSMVFLLVLFVTALDSNSL